MTSFVNIREIQVYKRLYTKEECSKNLQTIKKQFQKLAACIPQNITTFTENCQNEGYAVQKSNQNC